MTIMTFMTIVTTQKVILDDYNDLMALMTFNGLYAHVHDPRPLSHQRRTFSTVSTNISKIPPKYHKGT